MGDVVSGGSSAVLPAVGKKGSVGTRGGGIALLMLPSNVARRGTVARRGLRAVRVASMGRVRMLSGRGPRELMGRVLSVTRRLGRRHGGGTAFGGNVVTTNTTKLFINTFVTDYYRG